MPERNTTDERDRASDDELIDAFKAAAGVAALRDYVRESFCTPRHIDLSTFREHLIAYGRKLLAVARPDERAVREAIRKAVKQVIIHGAPLGTDEAPFFAALDKHYPAIPQPIPPCPLSGGREVRVDPTRPRAFQYRPRPHAEWVDRWGNTDCAILTLANTTADARTLADWLDSLPDAERA